MSPQPAHNVPPIITYPEFLTTPPSPAPLITAHRLLRTLYLFGGLSLLLHGTHKYLVSPLQSSLTASRLSLSQTAQSNLVKLIQKLSSQVSEIPPTIVHSTGAYRDADSDDTDSDSDPTELFHRDIGIQTSLPPSRTASPYPPGTPGATPPFSTPEATIGSHINRLRSIKSHLNDVADASSSESRDILELTVTVSVLKDYLDGLAYVAPTFSYGGGFGVTKDKEDDEISRVKSSIRSVKGVLLSARSFPGGVGRVR
jgi:hypothetical protein